MQSYGVLRYSSAKIVWEITVVLGGCFQSYFAFQLCLIRESRIFNRMPSTHASTQSVDSCPVLFSLLLETRLVLPLELPAWDLACFVALGNVILIDSVLSRDEHLAGVTY